MLKAKSVAKYYHKGRLISSPTELLLTLQKEYKHGLQKRKVKNSLKEHIEMMHDKKKKSNGTLRSIMNMVKDLQNYTIQNGVIYNI